MYGPEGTHGSTSLLGSEGTPDHPDVTSPDEPEIPGFCEPEEETE